MKLKLLRITTVPGSLNLLCGQLSFLNKYFKVIGISGPGYALEEVSEREKIRTIPVKMERHFFFVIDLFSVKKLYMTFKKEKTQIVHSVTQKAGIISAIVS